MESDPWFLQVGSVSYTMAALFLGPHFESLSLFRSPHCHGRPEPHMETSPLAFIMGTLIPCKQFKVPSYLHLGISIESVTSIALPFLAQCADNLNDSILSIAS